VQSLAAEPGAKFGVVDSSEVIFALAAFTSCKMKVVGLVSGGKDSIYSLMKCIEYGHEVIALANLRPADVQIQELDSFCFQTVGHNCVDAQAAAMRLPLFRCSLHGGSKNQDLQYTQTAEDEVEDLFTLLRAVQIAMPEVQAVSCGAILSTYQRTRVENVCRRLGLVALSFLWQRNQEELLHEMIGAGINAALIKVSSSGLLPRKHIMRTLGDMESDFLKLVQYFRTDFLF
jgi:diphthine-ammonia ligase